MSEIKPQLTPDRIMQFSSGYAPPLIVEAAIYHRVFDVLDGGLMTLQEVTEATGASRRGLRAIMDALTSLSLLAKDDQGRYALTPESAAFLVKGKPAYRGAIFRHATQQLLPKWLQMNEIVRTGKPARVVDQQDDGAVFFAEFVEALFPNNYPAALALGDALKLGGAAAPISVLDLGAGSGVWGIALAQKSPQVRVTAVDWPGVLPVTRRVATRFGVVDRFRFVEGNLQDVDFGEGYDVVTLGHILHSEGAERSRALLRKVFAALAPGGTVSIAEMLPNEERTGPPQPLIFAVNMLVNTDDGDTFSFGEIRGWLEEAGFVEARTIPAPAPSPLILAQRPAS